MFVKRQKTTGYDFCNDCGETFDHGEESFDVSTKYTQAQVKLCRACLQALVGVINKELSKDGKQK